MNISSLNLFGNNYSTWLTNLNQGSRSIGSSQNGGNGGTFANRLTSADGDTFQMSPKAMMGGMSSRQSGNGVDLGSFLEKVKNGTVTDEDIENLKAQLTEAADQAESTAGSGESTEVKDLRDSIKELLDKVKDGTVTEDDLSEMKDLLANTQASASLAGMPPMGGGPPPMGPPPSDENREAIGSFLDKVKAGAVTESDLTDLQELLTSMEEASDSTEETTASQSSSFKDAIESFLDKVKAGTVTKEDLTALKGTLDEMPPKLGGMNNLSTSGLEDFLKYLEGESGTGSGENRSYTTEQLRQALKAYQGSGYQDHSSDYWQYYA
ncbi:MAG: hypothetical protein HPY50_00030 [Firmicutes bacterium]|nr:hypothetical protein [Bacillota bacterium]